MEVASPLTFSHAAAGNKRQFPGSPAGGLVDSTNHHHHHHRSPFSPMDSTDEYGNAARFKRRRFNLEDSSMGDDEQTLSPSFIQPTKNYFNGNNAFAAQAHSTSKRCRTEDGRQQNNEHLERVVESQAAEIASLKSEKQNMENSFNSLKSEHEKVIHENKILKKAVTIQQERQGQAAGELESARQYKAGAEEQIRKLEQIILSLRYHLQQSNHTGNDFMGFQRPPDVY